MTKNLFPKFNFLLLTLPFLFSSEAAALDGGEIQRENANNTKLMDEVDNSGKVKTDTTKSTPEPKSGKKPAGKSGLANPASVNCHEKKGELKIVKGPGGGEYGICVFDDNRQCEEWAMFRGECPEGGVKVTGYYTPEGVFCAITGGSYDEKAGKCTLKNGVVCGAVEHYNLECR